MVEYVGLDVSKEATAYCVKDEQGKVARDPDALFAVLREHCLCAERIVLETGTLSNRLARELRKRGLPVTIADARRAHAMLRLQHNKADESDAALLAAQETLLLLSIPGMRESIREGMAEPFEQCSENLEW